MKRASETAYLAKRSETTAVVWWPARPLRGRQVHGCSMDITCRRTGSSTIAPCVVRVASQSRMGVKVCAELVIQGLRDRVVE